jgi:hypothetical protein
VLVLSAVGVEEARDAHIEQWVADHAFSRTVGVAIAGDWPLDDILGWLHGVLYGGVLDRGVRWAHVICACIFGLCVVCGIAVW